MQLVRSFEARGEDGNDYVILEWLNETRGRRNFDGVRQRFGVGTREWTLDDRRSGVDQIDAKKYKIVSTNVVVREIG
jgi:hypothetical protein